MIEEARRTLFALACYLAGITAILGGLGAFIVASVKIIPTLLPIEELQKPVLQIQLESARDIKTALSRPILPPEPLPPVTAKLANPASVKVTIEDRAKSQRKRRMPQIAREAFGMGPSPDESSAQASTNYYPPVDRFKPL